MPSQKELLDLFIYHNDGTVTRRRNHYCTKKGALAGFKNKAGYWYVKVYQKRIALHRVIWIMHNGEIPPGMVVDHINRVRDDNRIENLRIASYKTNARNMSIKKGNLSGLKGVSYSKRDRMWIARIRYNGRDVMLGRFSKRDHAIIARHVAETLCGYEHVRNLNDILNEE